MALRRLTGIFLDSKLVIECVFRDDPILMQTPLNMTVCPFFTSKSSLLFTFAPFYVWQRNM